MKPFGRLYAIGTGSQNFTQDFKFLLQASKTGIKHISDFVSMIYLNSIHGLLRKLLDSYRKRGLLLK